jgi:hypothetical protein
MGGQRMAAWAMRDKRPSAVQKVTARFTNRQNFRDGSRWAAQLLLSDEAVEISVLSARFKTLPAWLENSLGVIVVSCC